MTLIITHPSVPELFNMFIVHTAAFMLVLYGLKRVGVEL